MALEYKGYFNFDGGYNDLTKEDTLKDNELSMLVNAVITEKGAIKIRHGAVPLNDDSKDEKITRRYEYLVRDTSRILTVYDKDLYRETPEGDIFIKDIKSERPVFLRQQDALYVCDGVNIYEIGGKDYFSNVGTVNIKAGDIVQITDDFSATGIRGYFYKAEANLGTINLSEENYNNSARWDDCTDILYATSNITRTLKAYEAGKKEVTTISVFGEVTESGYITMHLHGASYDVEVEEGYSARAVAFNIKQETFPGYTVTSKQNVVTFTADNIGYREDAYAESYDTGVSLVVTTEVNGEDDDNILNEVRNCTIFTQHTKSGRYVATGNPNKPSAVYFSEPYQFNYFKQFNVLYPTSSEGTPVCMLNLTESIVIGYRHSWYEYTGIDPAIDGTWKRLAIPYGCACGDSVQVIDLYNFIYLADNGLYLVSANILNQYGVTMQNSTSIKCISDNVENTIKSIPNKDKCVSVYHDKIYYLAFTDYIEGDNYKVLLYYTDKKAYTLFTDVYVNDFLYRANGNLEFASMNYSMKFGDTYFDVNPQSGLEMPIDFIMTTANLSLDNKVAHKFIDKIFIQANIGAEDYDKHLKLAVLIDDIEVTEMVFNLAKLNEGLVWGELWGSPWGNYSTNLQSLFIREKGNRITLSFTNIIEPEVNTNITIYGFVISYKPLLAYQPIANLEFVNMPYMEE